MKITIKAEAQTPYTTEIVSQDIVIEIYHAREETDKQILWAAHQVEKIVNREVDKQMESRGIKLGRSVASPYTVRQRESDGVWCIYMRQYNCVVAEFGKPNRYDAETIGAILDGK